MPDLSGRKKELIWSVTFPYLVRRLGINTYEIWSYVLAVFSFLGIVANPGLTTFTSQAVAARRKAAFDLLPDVLTLRAIGTVVALIILRIVVMFEARSDVRELFYLYGIGVSITNLMSPDYLLTALEMFHESALLTTIQQSLYAAGIFALIRSPRDVLWLPISILGSAVISNSAGWIILWRRDFRFKWSIHPERWKEILVPSSHYAMSSVMSTVYHRTGHIAVRWFLGEHALGLYAAATRLVDISRQFVLILSNVLMPRMAAAWKSNSGLIQVARFATFVIAAGSIPVAVGLLATAHLVVPWLLGASYAPDISLVRWMSPFVVTSSAASLLSGILYATGRHRPYFFAATGGAAAGMILYFTLIPTVGLSGAALAFVLAELVVAVIAYASLPAELRTIGRSPVVGAALFSALLMAIVVRVVNLYTNRLYLVVPAGALVYLISCGWMSRKWLLRELRHDSAKEMPQRS
jgi:O-antigen/teichoic acid export membrane protein